MSATSVAVRALDAPLLRRLLRRLGRRHGTLVLVYHRIGDPTASPLHRDLFSATPEGFAAQLDVLAEEAEVVDASALATPPRGAGRRVAITFDDGYRDTAEVAWPLLAARGLPATVFLATGFLDAPRLAWWDELAWMVAAAGWPPAATTGLCARYAALPSAAAEALLDEVARDAGCGRAPHAAASGVWMDWEQARGLRDAGMAIGGHTVTHPVLSRVDDARLEREVTGCRAALAERLDVPMRLFSYPLGGPADVDGRAAAAVARAGVELAFTCAGGLAHGDAGARYHVPRASPPTSAEDVRARFRTMVALPEVFARW